MKFTKAERMCYNKRRFPSEIAASCAIGRIKAKYPEMAQVDLRWYKCPVCAGFHITKESQDNPEYQKRKWMAGKTI